MAEALGIAASIIAVLQATSKVISICYDYKACASDSSWELPKIIDEIKGLRNVLETLERLASEIDVAQPAAKARLPTLQLLCGPGDGADTGLLDLCLEELVKLKDRLAPPKWLGPRGSRRQAIGQVLRWPLNRGDTVKMLETIGRFRDLLILALTADQTTLVLKIEESVQAIKESTTSVHDALGILTKSIKLKELDDHLKKIHKWLDAPDPSSNHVVALGKRELTTGSWFIGGKIFDAWKRTPNSILWLHSIPGGGKTILSSTIIQTCYEYCNSSYRVDASSSASTIWAVAYFYFDFADTVKQNYSKMLCSLLKQLSEQLRYTSDSLEKLFNDSTSGSGQTPSDSILLQTLGDVIAEFDQVFLVIDALDECAQRFFLLEGITEMHEGWEHEMLHLLVTSRYEHDISSEFDSLIEANEEVHIHKSFIEADIRAYVYSRLQSDRRLKRWQKDKQVQKVIATTLTEKADGMFRWAACQLDELKTCFSRRDLHVALESLPKDLDDTYAQILCRIDEDRSDTVITILKWLAYSARPLQIEELADIVTVKVDSTPRIDLEARFLEPRDLLTICSSLVTTNLELKGSAIGQMVGEQIKLAHLSVRDYLTSKRILSSKAFTYSIQEMRAHDTIAQICLAYLLQFGEDNELPEPEVSQPHFPLSKYAAKYWPYHINASGTESEEVVRLCMELFTNTKAFEAWINIYDTDMVSSEGQMADGPPFRASPLYYVSQVGLKKPVQLLLDNGARCSQYGGIYGYALQAAAAAGHHTTCQILLEGGRENIGADPDAQGGAANNALNAACQEGHLEVVKILLQKKANVNITGGTFANPLQAASAGGFYQIVEVLIGAGANVDRVGGHYRTSLIAASYGGHEKVVEVLLANGAEIESTDTSGRTPLSQAASEGRTNVVRLLLKNGADVNHEDNDGWGPLDEASPGGHYDCVVALLEAGAAVNAVDKEGNTALHFTAAQPHPKVVRLLLDNGADIHLANSRREQVIYSAAWAGRYANLQILLEFGANVNALADYMWTPLHAAIATGNEKIVGLLLENGAEFTSDSDGWSALHIAVLIGNEEMVNFLLVRGVDRLAIDADGQTPSNWAAFTAEELEGALYKLRYKQKNSFTITGLRIAASQGHDVRVRQLLKNGADIDARDDGGWSALMWAALEGHRSTMLILLKAGADVNVKNDEGQTIMDFVDRWQDDTLWEIVDNKFDYAAIEASKLLLSEKRQRIRDLLENTAESSDELPDAPPPYAITDALPIRGRDSEVIDTSS